jgi:uncharacterized membrane protein
MKGILSFIKTTITGGIIFLLPLLLIVILLGKAFSLLRPLLQRAVTSLHIETFFGATLLTVLTILVIALLCFAAGLLIHLEKVKRIGKATEELVLRFVPGFAYLKTLAGEQINEDNRSHWKAVLLEDGDSWVIAFIVDENINGYSTVFIPESPRGDSGNSKTMLTSTLHYHAITTREALNGLRHYGAGLLPLLNKRNSPERPDSKQRSVL